MKKFKIYFCFVDSNGLVICSEDGNEENHVEEIIAEDIPRAIRQLTKKIPDAVVIDIVEVEDGNS